ncbi:putative repeat protein (TIGR03806 family) [Haloferula luteola]|uniref:Putative repeat protein (TIGR03806 family) n=1 Tax=Haloferula luteola TaxID=595692 RepID=A0A840VC46_9BACT|nr:LamG-like jellyroll fold domain-containing protein [Haloferula luteola]MBB5352238.1 putative repeat protein (TIGR03806 family) [Haloferula luteola]
MPRNPQCLVATTLLALVSATSAASLYHRYSFAEDASDAVGDAHGTLQGGVNVAEGKAHFSGTRGETIDLIGQIDIGSRFGTTGVSLEAWFTDQNSARYAKLFGFGDTSEGGFLGYTFSHAPISDTKIETPSTTAEANVTFLRPALDVPHHAVVTVSPSGEVNAWIDGEKVVDQHTPTERLPLTSVAAGSDQLGNSIWPDRSLNGSLDEFRIWSGELTGAEVLAHLEAGPDDSSLVTDQDEDGLPDVWEARHGLDPSRTDDPDGATGDPDGDGLNNAGELQWQTDPQNPDTDNDGQSDGEEVAAGSDPLDPDSLPPSPLDLRYRFSFDDTLDSVGHAQGLLIGNAEISGGQLHLHGEPGEFFDLGNQIQPGIQFAETGLTVEAWYVDEQSPLYAKIFGFGGAGENQFFGFTHAHGSADSTLVDLPSINGTGNARIDRALTGVTHHLVVSLAPSGLTRVWIDGEPRVADHFNDATLPISSIGQGFDRIGNSAWPDPSHRGTIDEVRIWSGEFTEDDVAASYQAGPKRVGALPDEDQDGMPDAWEIAHELDPQDATGDNGADADLDEDQLTNYQEYLYQTDPRNPDSDEDGLPDGMEILIGTHPLHPDSDGDSLPDGVETRTGEFVSPEDRGTDPLKTDTDGDGFSDADEDPSQGGTDPNRADSDDDGYDDLVEIRGGSIPTDPTSQPSSGLGRSEAFAAFAGGRFPESAPGTGSTFTVEEAFPELPNLTDPMFMTPLPGTDRLLVIQKRGDIRVLDASPTANSFETFLDIRSRVFTVSDCGMTGMAFHPQFSDPDHPQRYVYITYKWNPRAAVVDGGAGVSGGNNNWAYWRLSRFEVPPGSEAANPESELVLVQQFDRQMYHDSGCLLFGQDGYLYFAIGDEGGADDEFNVTQKIDERLFSGIFRIDVDPESALSHPIRRQPLQHNDQPSGWPDSFTAHYSIPNDNPFVDPAPIDGVANVLEEYFALGLRQPYRFSQDQETGLIWIGESGQNAREEIDLLAPGANYQWPFREGNIAGPKARPDTIVGIEKEPIIAYDRTQGGCLIGGYVYHGDRLPELRGKYLAVDNVSAAIWAVDPPSESAAAEITSLGVMRPGSVYSGSSSCALDAQGEFYFLKLQGDGGGRIWQLAVEDTTPEPPALLSQTGLFSDLATLTPAPGFLPYDLVAPLWSDGAHKRRWIAVPNDGIHDSPTERITFNAHGNWQFPAGTITIKHFELPIDESHPDLTIRLETRVIVATEDGGKYAVTYRWNAEQTDAELLTESQTHTFLIQEAEGGSHEQTWYYPSRTDCLACHTEPAGQALGIRTQHFNHDIVYPGSTRPANQLATFSALGILDQTLTTEEIAQYVQSRALDDSTAPLALRVRSYLDSNCSHCHQPNGGIPGFDARLTTPLSEQGLIHGEPGQFGALGPDSRYIVPGDVPLSIIHHRMNAVGNGAAMPPLAKGLRDDPAVQWVASWIQGLDPADFIETEGQRPIRTELAGPSGLINGPFDITLATDQEITGLQTENFEAVGAPLSDLRGERDHYRVRVVPQEEGHISIRLPANALIPPGDPGLGSLESETVEVTYLRADDGYLEWARQQSLSGEAALPETASIGQLANLLRYQFNLPADRPDLPTYIPGSTNSGTGPSGLPSFRRLGPEEGGRLEVTYLRRRDARDAGYQFDVQFTDSLEGSWLNSTSTEQVTFLDSIWEQVVVQDTGSASSHRFGRLRILYSPSD